MKGALINLFLGMAGLGLLAGFCAFVGALGWIAAFGPWPAPPDFFVRLLAGGIAAIAVGLIGAATADRL